MRTGKLAALPRSFDQSRNQCQSSQQPQHWLQANAAHQGPCQNERQTQGNVDQVVLESKHSSPLCFGGFLLNGGLSGNRY